MRTRQQPLLWDTAKESQRIRILHGLQLIKRRRLALRGASQIVEAQPEGSYYGIPLGRTDSSRPPRRHEPGLAHPSGYPSMASWRPGSQFGGRYVRIMLLKSSASMGAWDLMTAAIMLDPALCDFQPLHLVVITEAGDNQGQTLSRGPADPNVQVCLHPHADAIRQTLAGSSRTASSSAAHPAKKSRKLSCPLDQGWTRPAAGMLFWFRSYDGIGKSDLHAR